MKTKQAAFLFFPLMFAFGGFNWGHHASFGDFWRDFSNQGRYAQSYGADDPSDTDNQDQNADSGQNRNASSDSTFTANPPSTITDVVDSTTSSNDLSAGGDLSTPSSTPLVPNTGSFSTTVPIQL